MSSGSQWAAASTVMMMSASTTGGGLTSVSGRTGWCWLVILHL